MPRQVRSEVTRRKLLDAAIDVFNEVGYVSAGRAAIIERAGVTKGALYHHFDSMESLVVAIIEGGFTTMLDAFRGMCQPATPALEGLIHGMFAVVDVSAIDKEARVAGRLVFTLAEANDSAGAVCGEWLTEVVTQTRRAIAEGDLRDDLDPQQVGESIAGTALGVLLLSPVTSADAAVNRLTQTWELLLAGLVAEESLPYFREFLAREALRHQAVLPPRGADTVSGADGNE